MTFEKELSGKYSIGDSVMVNTENCEIIVNSNTISLRRQVYLALLLLMENRVHESAVPVASFSKTQPEGRNKNDSEISPESVRKIVAEINSKLQSKVVVAKKGVGYYLVPEVKKLESANIEMPPMSPEPINIFSEIADKLNNTISELPNLIENTIIKAISANDQASGYFGKPEEVLQADSSVSIIDDDQTKYQPSLYIPQIKTANSKKNKNFFSVGDTVLRHWKLTELVASGSYATVYKACREENNEIYHAAIKIIQPFIRSVPIEYVSDDSTHIIDATSMGKNELLNMIALKGNSYGYL